MAKKILMASQEEMILELLLATVGRDERYRILIARNEEEILRIARRERPSIVLMDSLMPDQEYHRICRTLRSYLKGASTRVIMLDVGTPEFYDKEADDIEADECVEMPYSPTALLETLQVGKPLP